MGWGIFGGGSTTRVENRTENTADSYNTSMSRNDIASESGNTTVYLNTTPGEANAPPAGSALAKYLPLVALACFGLAILLLLTSRSKIPTPSTHGLHV
jgi:hypothetical protein